MCLSALSCVRDKDRGKLVRKAARDSTRSSLVGKIFAYCS